MLYFVGAGCGAVDLITVRGARLLAKADQVIYAGSLVNPELLDYCSSQAHLLNSAEMTLEEVLEAICAAEASGKMTVRLHSGDSSLYGATREQMEELDKKRIPYEVVPGVSSFSGAAAALKAEYTVPGVSQSVIITRMAGRTPVPEREKMSELAAHRTSMVIFLSTGLLDALQEELLQGGYPPETRAAIVYKASWPDEQVHRCTVATIAETAGRHQLTRTSLILVGDFLDESYQRSQLYHPSFSTLYRKASDHED